MRMYSSILRLGLKFVPPAAAVWNALLGLLWGAATVFGREWLQPKREKHTEGVTEVQVRDFVNFWLFIFACGCFLSFAILAALILVPARRERQRVARQLRTFDVREAEAWSAADKLYVLEKVRSWNGDSEEALVSFNNLVRTDVAVRLGWMQWRREVALALLILLVFFLLWCGLALSMSVFVTGTSEPLGWPTIQVDLATWAVPDHCLLANPWIHQGHCNTTMGAGHHSWVRDAPCFNGTLVDAPAQVPEGCVPSLFRSLTRDTWYVSADAQQIGWITYAAMLCYTLAVCGGTMWWARPETRAYAKEEAPKGTKVETTAGAGNGAMDSGAAAGGGVERPSHPPTADAQAEAEASASAPAAAALNLEA